MKTDIIRRIILSVIMIGVLLIGGQALINVGASLREEPERVQVEPIPLAVTAEPLRRGPVTERIRGYGLAQPLRQSTVAPQIAGVITAIAEGLRVGASVEQGQTLLTLETTTLEAELRRREALLEEARETLARTQAELEETRQRRELIQADLELAQANLQRTTELFAQGAASQSALDTAQERLQGVQQRLSESDRALTIGGSAITSARKSIAARTAEVEQAQESLADATVTAPFTGVIDERFVDPGDYVNPGTPAFRLVDLSTLELPIEIPASRALALRNGASAEVRTDEKAPRTAEGTVERVSPTIDPASRTVGAYVVIGAGPDGRPLFSPGAFLTAHVEGRTWEDVFAIPRAAIVDGAIYLAREGHAQELRPEFFVFLDDIALTREDLGPAPQLITSGFERLYQGAPIRLPTEQGATPAGTPEAAEVPPADLEVTAAPGL